MNVETLDRCTITEADARAIAELLVSIWPKPGRTVEVRTAEIMAQGQDYRGQDAQRPSSFLVREGGRVIAHANAAPRTIATSAGEMTVLALAQVCTDAAARGRSLGKAVVRRAFELVDNGAYPFALFQTSEAVRPFYERLGAVPVENTFINSQAADPTARPWWDTEIMRYPAKPGWPAGEIDLQGRAW